jgi:hypothetical protein
MPPAGSAETTDSRARASSATPAARMRGSGRRVVRVVSSPPRIEQQGISTPETVKADDSALKGMWKRISGWVTALGIAGGVLTAILTFVGITFDLFPALKPETPPTELAVAVDDVELEERVMTESGAHRLIVSYGITFTGYKEDRIHIEWAAFDSQTLARVRLAPSVLLSSRNLGNGTVGDYLTGRAETDRGRGRIEFAAPVEGGCIFVRVYVYDIQFNRLDYGDTPPFHRTDPMQSCDGPTEESMP